MGGGTHSPPVKIQNLGNPEVFTWKEKNESTGASFQCKLASTEYLLHQLEKYRS